MEIRSDSTRRTIEVAARLGKLLSPGDVVGLQGELGTGKTVVVRGIARGLGYQGPVQSPTFTIMRTYPLIRLCHVDAFRLDGADQLFDIGIEEYMDGEWVCVIEWADRVRDAVPGEALTVHLYSGEGEDDRLITVAGSVEWERRISGLEEVPAGEE